MKILLFGKIAEQIGSNHIFLENIHSTEKLKEKLVEHYPFLQQTSFSIAIDRKIIHTDITLLDAQEIALLPPFSGG